MPNAPMAAILAHTATTRLLARSSGDFNSHLSTPLDVKANEVAALVEGGSIEVSQEDFKILKAASSDLVKEATRDHRGKTCPERCVPCEELRAARTLLTFLDWLRPTTAVVKKGRVTSTTLRPTRRTWLPLLVLPAAVPIVTSDVIALGMAAASYAGLALFFKSRRSSTALESVLKPASPEVSAELSTAEEVAQAAVIARDVLDDLLDDPQITLDLSAAETLVDATERVSGHRDLETVGPLLAYRATSWASAVRGTLEALSHDRDCKGASESFSSSASILLAEAIALEAELTPIRPSRLAENEAFLRWKYTDPDSALVL